MYKSHSLPVWQFLAILLLLSLLCFFFFEVTRREPSVPTNADALRLTVILDAGHGGEDGGTSTEDGVYEKDLNLAMVMTLKELLEASGVEVILTRDSDTLLYDRTVDYQGRKKALDLAARLKITEEHSDAILVSIHMNSYPSPRYRGLQVWYSPNHPDSRVWAEAIQSTVRTSLQPDNTRAIKEADGKIGLLDRVTIPAVLIECGFLSNSEEAALLCDEQYRMELCRVLVAAILQNAK